MSQPFPSRAKAAQILAAIMSQRSSLKYLLAPVMKHHPDKAFIKALTHGVCRHYFSLKATADLLLKQPLKTKDRDILALILIGLFQLDYLNTPEYVALNETVQACQSLKKPWARGLVTAVLRRYLRQREGIQKGAVQKPKAYYNHPHWLLTRLQEAWPNNWEDIVSINNTIAPMSLRLNCAYATRERYLHLLQESGHEAYPSQNSPVGIILQSPCDPTRLPGFQEGGITVQNIASQLVIYNWLLPSKARVLDACAAPGGKASHLLEQNPDIDLVALEKVPERFKQLQQTFERLQLKATLHNQPLEQVNKWWGGELFDAILLDAPCSGTGVIRRHPDIKLLRHDEDIPIQAQQQYDMLKQAWSLLNSKGELLYSTCSLLPQENQQVLQSFLTEHPEAKIKQLNIQGSITVKPGGQQLLPSDEVDGFYSIVLVKDSNSINSKND